MRRWVAAVVLLGLLGTGSYAADAEMQAIREAVRLPTVTIRLDLRWTTLGSPEEKKDGADEDVTTLRSRLTGDETDAEIYCDLGDRYERDGQPDQASEAHRQAVRLASRRRAVNPRDWAATRVLTRALFALDRQEEGWMVIREATLQAGTDQQAWTDLGCRLLGEGLRKLCGPRRGAEAALGQMASTDTPSVSMAEARQAEELLAEARSCLDQAVRLAPDDFEARQARFWFSFHRWRLGAALRRALGGSPELSSLSIPAELLEDSRSFLRLKAEDPDALAFAAYIEFFSIPSFTGYQNARLPPNFWDAMPEPNRASVSTFLDALGRLGSNPDRRLASRALELRASLLLMLHRESEAAATALQAVTLDPTRDSAWELAHALNTDESGVAVGWNRLRTGDSPRARFLLARSYQEVKDFNRVEEELEKAHLRFPDSPVVALALAAILMRQNGDLHRVDQLLRQVEEHIKKEPRSDLGLSFINLLAAHRALCGEVPEAATLLEGVLKFAPGDRQATALLQVVRPLLYKQQADKSPCQDHSNQDPLTVFPWSPLGQRPAKKVPPVKGGQPAGQGPLGIALPAVGAALPARP